MKLSFITANYVAREVGFMMTDWGHGDRAANAFYQPIDTYAARFGTLLDIIAAQGYRHVDIWTAHLNWTWATPAHHAIANQLLKDRGLTALCYGGRFGETVAEFTTACQTAHALGIQVLAGSTGALATDRAAVVRILKQYDCRLAIENHPQEKTPADILALIGDGGDGYIGTAVDTGWWGTQGYDAAHAITELYPYIMAVHLKDVRAAGAHDTCRWGEGVVPIAECVRILRTRGYSGPLAVEHEPHDFDPTADCIAMHQMMAAWWR